MGVCDARQSGAKLEVGFDEVVRDDEAADPLGREGRRPIDHACLATGEVQQVPEGQGEAVAAKGRGGLHDAKKHQLAEEDVSRRDPKHFVEPRKLEHEVVRDSVSIGVLARSERRPCDGTIAGVNGVEAGARALVEEAIEIGESALSRKRPDVVQGEPVNGQDSHRCAIGGNVQNEGVST